MNYKFYYYAEDEMCILFDSMLEKPEINSIANNSLSLKVYLSDKSVENIYSFFKENTIRQLLSDNTSLINIDYSEIENLPFYSDDSFMKLKELIEESKTKCNNVIADFINRADDNSDEELAELIEESIEEESILVGSSVE